MPSASTTSRANSRRSADPGVGSAPVQIALLERIGVEIVQLVELVLAALVDPVDVLVAVGPYGLVGHADEPALPSLAERRLRDGKLSTRVRLATLFVDIAGSTRLLAHHPAETVLACIQRFMRLVAEVALAYCRPALSRIGERSGRGGPRHPRGPRDRRPPMASWSRSGPSSRARQKPPARNSPSEAPQTQPPRRRDGGRCLTSSQFSNAVTSWSPPRRYSEPRAPARIATTITLPSHRG